VRCLPSECWKEENISRKALCFTVTVSKLGKTDLVFVQPGAKINSVYYCENVLEQGLPMAVRRISNMTTCSSRMEHHALRSPHCRLPAFQCAWVHWTRKLAAKQSRSKCRGLLSVDSVVTDGVTSQNFRHWSAEASSDRLLGSAKPGHTELSDWSADKKIDDCYQSKGWSCWILSELTICVRDRLCFTVFQMKIEQSSCVIVKFDAILGVLTIYAN